MLRTGSFLIENISVEFAEMFEIDDQVGVNSFFSVTHCFVLTFSIISANWDSSGLAK